MAYDKNTDWLSKEKRELFGKSANTQLMADPKKPLKDRLEEAKETVDRAFELYPDKVEKKAKEEKKIF